LRKEDQVEVFGKRGVSIFPKLELYSQATLRKSDAIQYARNELDFNSLGIGRRKERVNHPKTHGTVRTT